MPTYTYFCKHCNTRQDAVRKIDDRDNAPLCCEHTTERQIAAAMVPVMGIATSRSHHSGRSFSGIKDYESYLKTNDLIPASDAASEAKHQKKNIEVERKAELRKDVIEAVTKIN